MCFTSFKRIQAKQGLCDFDNFAVIISAKPQQPCLKNYFLLEVLVGK